MEAMHCLRMPHGPAGGPGCPHSSSSRRNPLLRRHLTFPKGGAKVVAAPRWTVRAQAPPAPPSQPGGEDANPKGRLGGWHRTRGAAVGAAVVLACALGAACLNRRVGAYCCTKGGPETKLADGGSANLQTSVAVLSSIFKPRDAPPKAPKERAMLLQHFIEEITAEDYYCLEASRREYAIMNALDENWPYLEEGVAKYELGLSLMELFISKRDYNKALKICEDIIKWRRKVDGIKDAEHSSDRRPYLYLAIIKMMQAVDITLDPNKQSDDLKTAIEEAKEAGKIWKTSPLPPTPPSETRT